MEMYDWNEAQVGYSLSFVGLLVAIVQGGLIGVVVKKLGKSKTVIIGFCLWTLGMFLFSLATEPWMIYAFLIPYALGGVAGPTLNGILSNQVSVKEQGNLQGSLTSMISVTTIIGPAIATFLFYQFTGDKAPFYFPGAPYTAGAILLLLSTAVAVFGLRRIKDID